MTTWDRIFIMSAYHHPPFPFFGGLFCVSWQHTGIFAVQSIVIKGDWFIFTLCYHFSCLHDGILPGAREIAVPGPCLWNRGKGVVMMEDTWDEMADGWRATTGWLKITFLFSSFWKSLYPCGRKTDGGTIKKLVPVPAEHKRMHLDSKPQLWINWQIYLWAYQGPKTIILAGKWKWHCVAHSHSLVNCSWNGC